MTGLYEDTWSTSESDSYSRAPLFSARLFNQTPSQQRHVSNESNSRTIEEFSLSEFLEVIILSILGNQIIIPVVILSRADKVVIH